MPDYPEFIHKNLSDSAADFQKIVWPAICGSPIIGGGEIVPVELNTSGAFAVELDLLAGIDAWHVLENKRGMRSVASRVQWGSDYRSFTIGYKPSNPLECEYGKRLFAIENKDAGILYPHITAQAFLDARGGNLLSVAAIRTELLILKARQLIEWGKMDQSSDKRFGLRENSDGRHFLYMSWEYLSHTELGDELHVIAEQT